MFKKIDIENYIENRYREYCKVLPEKEWDIQYVEFYQDIKPEKLSKLFAAFHASLTRLFSQMNDRLPTGEEFGAHYWAEQSRELITIIESINALSRVLKNTEYEFCIDDYYEEVFASCSRWLSGSGGSTIPPNTDKIMLYYKKPIFISVDPLIQFKELHELGTQNELIGKGGYGEVYKYHHPMLDIDFAVKVFDPVFATEESKIEGEKRFYREARMLFRLNHINIVRVFDVGRFHGKPFIKMEYISGESLDKLREEKGNLSFVDAAKAVKQILEGLQHAHENGIIHRDLKPNNVMVDMKGERWICKIIDFGVSAFMETDGYTKLTKTGDRIAGGNYIDPLLQDNPSLRDARSDIYSVSAIMYYLLCGRAPVGSDIERFLREGNRNLTDSQVKFVLKSLSMDIDKRFENCISMREAIESMIG